MRMEGVNPLDMSIITITHVRVFVELVICFYHHAV